LLTGPLAKVRLSGNYKLSGAQVLAAAGLAPGLPMSELDPITVTRSLAALPRVAAVDVRRVYPDHLWIDVRERTPSLRVRTAGLEAVIDANNVVIESGPVPADAAHLPLVLGVAPPPVPGQRLSDPALERAREFLALLRGAGMDGEQVNEIDATRAYMLAVRFSDGRHVLFSSGQTAAELRIWRELAAASPLADSPLAAGRGTTLDLRAAAQEDGRIALRP
jgi:cell division septal protein FtsQ